MANTETFTMSGGFPTIRKDPDATLDYTFDWTAWLAASGDTIAEVVWTAGDGLTVESTTHTTQTATAMVSGGAAGSTVGLACRITTTGGRVDERTMNLRIIQR